MGTLSENQAQEHNPEEDRPGGEDLGVGLSQDQTTREAQRGLRLPGTAWLAGGSDSGSLPVGAARPQAHGRASGAEWSGRRGLVPTCEPGPGSVFCFHLYAVLSPSLPLLPVRRGRGGDAGGRPGKPAGTCSSALGM